MTLRRLYSCKDIYCDENLILLGQYSYGWHENPIHWLLPLSGQMKQTTSLWFFVCSRKQGWTRHVTRRHSITYKIACTPSENSDQPAHPLILDRVFAMQSVGSKEPKASSSGQWGHWIAGADAPADRSLWWASMQSCGKCWKGSWFVSVPEAYKSNCVWLQTYLFCEVSAPIIRTNCLWNDWHVILKVHISPK